MRALWSGSISFGLVNIPVRLYSGVNPHEGIDLDMLHKDDNSPIRYARICRKDGEEVPWNDIVKGYEYRDGDYVVLTKKDLEKLDSEQTETIDIQHFVDEDEIDIRYYEHPYYLEPTKGGDKAYALLRGALESSGKSALVTFVMREREHLGVIKPVGRALVLTQMRFPTDLREATELKFPSETSVTKDEVKVALKLISQETKPFIPEDYEDTFTEELEDLIEAKTKGKKLKKRPSKQPDTQAKDLMTALKASLKEE
ncbi:MAG TPA: Ku protein [Candidatus Chromulinivoraceae bacterium]|nr:Ku protein [Candidatus Chromulinivoraceae bacterium]